MPHSPIVLRVYYELPGTSLRPYLVPMSPYDGRILVPVSSTGMESWYPVLVLTWACWYQNSARIRSRIYSASTSRSEHWPITKPYEELTLTVRFGPPQEADPVTPT
eukprot:3941511-Rhodomonas_salina.2